MVNKSHAYEITPRHLVFNVLAHCGGQIRRKELMEDMYQLCTELARKGFRVPAVLKGSRETGWWGEAIDSELLHWMDSGVIKQKKLDLYEFIESPTEPFTSPQQAVAFVNEGLHEEVRTTLQGLIQQVVACHFR